MATKTSEGETMKRKQVIENLEESIEQLHDLDGRLAGGDEDGVRCGIPILKDVPLDDYLPKSPWPDMRNLKKDCVPTEKTSQYIRSWILPGLISALDEIKNGK